MGKWQNINRRIAKQTELARIFADDGALHSAARVLKDLGAEVQKAAEAKDRALNRYIDDYNKRTDEINTMEGRADG